MARWKLREAHYIFAKQFGEKTEWEYKETDRITGRERRHRFDVPLYCEVGSIVCREGSEQHELDIIFDGPPTPAMDPLDDSAKAESAKYAGQWVHPIESLDGNFSADKLLMALQKQFAAAAATTPPPAIPVSDGVSREEFEALQSQLAALMAQNAELKAKPKAERRA